MPSRRPPTPRGAHAEPLSEEDEAPRDRPNLTGRAAMLALVVCLLAISLAYPLREYLSQRSDIGHLRAEVSQ